MWLPRAAIVGSIALQVLSHCFLIPSARRCGRVIPLMAFKQAVKRAGRNERGCISLLSVCQVDRHCGKLRGYLAGDAILNTSRRTSLGAVISIEMFSGSAAHSTRRMSALQGGGFVFSASACLNCA
jgi:hypothetical protein